jgi:hypothetical protein
LNRVDPSPGKQVCRTENVHTPGAHVHLADQRHRGLLRASRERPHDRRTDQKRIERSRRRISTPGLKTIAAVHSQYRRWVKGGGPAKGR